MRMVNAFMSGVTRLNDVIGRWISYLIYVMFFCLILEVGFRYLLNAPTVWTNELTQMLFGAYTMLAGGYVMAHRGHVNVDLLHAALSRRTQAFVDIFTAIIFYIFLLALLYFGSSMAWESFQSLETSYSAWNPPIWPVKATIPLGALLLLLQGTAKLVEDITIAVTGKTPDDEQPLRGEHS